MQNASSREGSEKKTSDLYVSNIFSIVLNFEPHHADLYVAVFVNNVESMYLGSESSKIDVSWIKITKTVTKVFQSM